MKKLLTILALLLLTGTAGLAQGETALYRTITEDYAEKADSLTYCFIEKFMNKTKGIFNEKPGTYAQYMYWQQAHCIDVLIYAYERHKDDNSTLANTYKTYITRWYNNKGNNYSGGSTGFENPYTDDMCWICLTLMHISEAFGTNTYFNTAKKLFDNAIMTRAKEDEETGGLWLPWNTDEGSGPNACTQSPATLIAAKMYQKYGTAKYLEYAKKLYAYTSQKIVKSDGRVEEPPLTYTQGTFGEACRLLYHITDESSKIKNNYKTLANTYISFAFTSNRCTNGNNILRDEGHNGDQSLFKAVLIPYAVNFVLDTEMGLSSRQNIAKYIQKNAKTMFGQLDWSRYPTVFVNFDWTTPYTGEDKDAMAQATASGASLLENTARLQKAIRENYQNYQDGIETLPIVENTENRYGVYTLDGRMIRTPWQDTDNLPKGMYIINKRKVLIK